MLIPLDHGKPIVFGPEGEERGVVQRPDGGLDVVAVADAGGIENLLVHDESREDPGLAFALSRLARGPYEPTPIGVFRAVERPEYGEQMSEQIIEAQSKRGLGDLGGLAALRLELDGRLEAFVTGAGRPPPPSAKPETLMSRRAVACCGALVRSLGAPFATRGVLGAATSF